MLVLRQEACNIVWRRIWFEDGGLEDGGLEDGGLEDGGLECGG